MFDRLRRKYLNWKQRQQKEEKMDDLKNKREKL